MIPQPYKPLPYTISPARGQALLNFAGRRMPEDMPLFEVNKVEQVGIAKAASNLLLHGDSLSACSYLKAMNIKVDLVYIDPPFASGANYAKKIFLRNGGETALDGGTPIGEELMYADIWQKEDYLNWLYERLLAIRQVMNEKGSIFVHLDWHIGHYVKILLDEVFGEENFVNEIVWHYEDKFATGGTSLDKNHDLIFLYQNSEESTANEVKIPKDEPSRRALRRKIKGKTVDIRDENGDKIWVEYTEKKIDDVWEIPRTISKDKYTHYTTQKPDELLTRAIQMASDAGMTVADFFSGSGTTAIVAHKLGRHFIASDVGLNAIQTSRDRLAAAGASFDVLKIHDGIRLFRNPAQTMAKIFSLVEGFRKREELELGEFWDGGMPGPSGHYSPLKFVGLHERLTPALLDVYLEEIYQLESDDRAEGVRILYAHRDLAVDQDYVNKRLRASGKTQLKVELVSLNELLDRKAASLFTPDSAILDVQPAGKNQCEVTVRQYFSPYLKAKIDEFNAKRGKKNGGELVETIANGNGEENGNGAEAAKPPVPFKPVTISETGLELIEAIQFDTTLRKDSVWVSNTALEDKAGPKEKIKGRYTVTTRTFKVKIRNISGDEIILDYPPARA